jgi:hypothetical protein
MRDERSNPVSPLVVLVGGVAFAAAYVFFMVWTSKVRPYQGWRALVRQVTPHEKARITLQAGETLVAVVETKKGTYFFLGTQTKKRSYSE